MIVLGPVPCQGCRAPVTWSGLEWQSKRGYRHVCRARIAGPKRASNRADGRVK